MLSELKYDYNYKFLPVFMQSFVVNCLFKYRSRLRCFLLLCDIFCFSPHYKLPFDVYAYTFDMCINKVYLLTYLLTYLLIEDGEARLRQLNATASSDDYDDDDDDD